MGGARWGRGHAAPVASGLLGFAVQVITHCFNIVTESGGIFLPLSSHFGDDWIIFHGRSINCSGVTIRGAEYPQLLQVRSILSASAALAKWRQFHVRRNDMRCTAAIAM
jgi:hypothetical protein